MVLRDIIISYAYKEGQKEDAKRTKDKDKPNYTA